MKTKQPFRKKTDPIAKLHAQIGRYGFASSPSDKDFVYGRTTSEARSALYKGVNKYTVQHSKKINRYTSRYGQPESKLESYYFRNAFIKKIIEIQKSGIPRYTGDEQLRETNSKDAAIRLVDFLGSEGAELYQLAIEEEMNSYAYRNAVFRASTQRINQSFKTPPVVIVAGPSGSGKSHAAGAVLEKTKEFLTTNRDKKGYQDIVTIDGGTVRATSQMRKLVIQAANHQGFSGIRDLHDKSDVLELMKDNLMETMLKSTNLGAVIPETYARWPFGLFSSWFMKRIESASNKKLLFCRVVGHEENTSTGRSRFEKVLAFMGLRRAFKNDGFDHQKQLNLNNKKITESKEYGGWKSFLFGFHGSLRAEAWFKKNSQSQLSMVVINDLILLKKQANKWVAAEPHDMGVIKVSQALYDRWKQACITNPKTDELETYIQNNAAPIIVKTSGAVELAIAIQMIEKLKPKENEQVQLDEIKKTLSRLHKQSHADVVQYEASLKKLLGTTFQKWSFFLFDNDTRKAIKQALYAIKQVKKEKECMMPEKTTDYRQQLNKGRKEFSNNQPDSEKEQPSKSTGNISPPHVTNPPRTNS